MKVRTQRGNLSPAMEVDELRSIVIYDDFDNPIFIMQKLEDGQLIGYRAGDSKFLEALKALGIGLNATVAEVSLRA